MSRTMITTSSGPLRTIRLSTSRTPPVRSMRYSTVTTSSVSSARPIPSIRIPATGAGTASGIELRSAGGAGVAGEGRGAPSRGPERPPRAGAAQFGRVGRAAVRARGATPGGQRVRERKRLVVEDPAQDPLGLGQRPLLRDVDEE